MLTVKMNGTNKDIIICSSYFPSESNFLPPTQEFVQVVEHCKINNLTLLSSIDANAHHLAWGSTNTNPKGDNLLEFIMSTDLMLLNIGNKPTFVNKLRKEVLDITLCTQDLFSQIFDWHVSNYILLSDHKCIAFKMNLDPLPPLLFRNPASTNWQVYNDLVGKNIGGIVHPRSIDNITDLDKLADSIQNLLVEAYETACPIRKHKAGTSVPYYSQEDKDQRKIVRRTFNACKANGIWSTYYEELSKYNKCLRRRERSGWKNQCRAISSMHDSVKMLKVLSKDPTQAVGSLMLPSGDYTKDQAETYKFLLNFHFPNSTILNDITYQNLPNIEGTVNSSLIDKIITEDTVKWAINSFIPLKYPGTDKIMPAMLQQASDHITELICILFKASLRLKYIPKSWRGVIVLFLPKPGKTNYSLAENYRPISLTSFLLKALEKLVDRYIRDGPLKTHKIHVTLYIT